MIGRRAALVRGLVTRTRRGLGPPESSVGGPSGVLTSAPQRRRPDQQVAELAGVAAADRQPVVADADRAPAAVDTHLVHVCKGDERTAVDPGEPGVAPALLECAERDLDQV